MPDREKVIQGLECCMAEKICASKCPYKGQCDDGGYYYSKAIEDAISLLKEQEPRVMTLEEVIEHSETEEKYIESEKAPVYVEYAEGITRPWARRWLTVDMLHSWLDYWETRIVYGKDWRCWTYRPTAEQREAVKWDG